MSKIMKTYTFNWMDEEGTKNIGWNSVQAYTKAEARRKAKKMESPAHWSLWDGSNYITVPNEVIGEGHCFRMKGMYFDDSTLRRVSHESYIRTWDATYMD